jgi:DNA-binding CsgD family transcriptional regulator
MRAIGLGLTDALTLLAEQGLLVIAIDDEQWLDSSSAAVLEFALRRLVDAPIALLLARRSGERGPRIERALPGDRVKGLVVEPFTLGATHALLREEFGHSFPRPTLVRIHETAGGNPFFVLELARSLERLPSGVEKRWRVPETLEAAVQGRLKRLPKWARPPLLAAAAMAAPTVPALEEGWPEATRSLAAAEQAGVIELEHGDVRFAHPLFASVLYDQATHSVRRQIHARLAELVADPVERARHLALARPGPNVVIAAALESAAAHARAHGAPIAAADLAELSLQRTPSAAAADRRRRCADASGAHLAAGDTARARELADELAGLADSPRSRAEALLLRADIEDRAGSRQGSIELLLEALTVTGGFPDLEVTARVRLALGLSWTEGVEAAAPHAEAAVELMKRLGDRTSASLALSSLAQVRFLAGEEGALELADRAFDLARETGDRAAVDTALNALTTILLWSGEISRARELLNVDLEEATGQDEGREAVSCWMLSLVEWRGGNWSLARELAERTRDLMSMLDDVMVFEAHLPLATVAAHQGEEAEAIDLVEFAQRELRARGHVLQASGHGGIIGLVELWSGNATAAVERFEAAADARDLGGFREPAGPRCFAADHVEALIELDRVDDAIAVLEPWAADAERLNREWALASVVRCRGLVAAARGEFPLAVALLQEAAHRHEAVGDPFGRNRALLALGSVLLRGGERRRARTTLADALEGFETLGAARWSLRTRAELARIGGRAQGNGLTPAQMRVAELVAEGRTNREVAAALYLSEKTIESHLSHIYAKLNLRSRTELARELARAS